MAKEQKLSPMMAQYFEIKKNYPGVILFTVLTQFLNQ